MRRPYILYLPLCRGVVVCYAAPRRSHRGSIDTNRYILPTYLPITMLASSLRWSLYFIGVGRNIIPPVDNIPPGQSLSDPPLDSAGRVKVIAFNGGRIATSANEDRPYLSNYPSYHSFWLSVTRPEGQAIELETLRDMNTMGLLKGGCITQGPIVIASGYASIVFKDCSNIRPFETLRVIYDTYASFNGNIDEYIGHESKFLVSLWRKSTFNT